MNKHGMERAALAATLERAALAATLEVAASGDERKIRGVANTFGLMRSGRVLHPEPMRRALQANPRFSVPLLAQHGEVDGLATIGEVTKLAVTERGLEFEARLAEGTPLADEAWSLVGQGMLRNLSVGWQAKQQRWIKTDDVDLDPHFKRVLEDAGETEALAYFDYELVEVSLVDVGDDAGAKLAARLDAQGGEIAALRAQLERLSGGGRPAVEPGDLRAEVAALRARLDRLAADAGTAKAALFVAALDDQIESYVERFKAAAFEAMLSDEDVLEEARQRYGDRLDEAATASDSDAAAGLLTQLEQIGGA